MDESLEVRRVTAAHLRVDSVDGTFRPVLRGYAIVFNSDSLDLGGFVEVVKPEAVNRTLEEKVDLRALVDHDSSKVIGRLSTGTLRVKPDATGLAVEIYPPNTGVGRDIVENVRRGDVDEMSFAFRTLKDEWDFTVDPPRRSLVDMRMREVSVVAFGAYPATNIDVAQRSLEGARRAARPPVSVQELRRRMEAQRAAWR